MDETNTSSAIPDEIVMSKIYLIRGRKVMLDRDLAELYGVETKRLKEAVRRNIERFPEDFMFLLKDEELKNLRTQIATSSWGGTKVKASRGRLSHSSGPGSPAISLPAALSLQG